MKQVQYVMVGYPFAGKTTLAKALAKQFGFVCFSIDEVKFSLGYEGISDDEIPQEAWDKIFGELDKQILETLRQGKTVVNEYAWLTRAWRDRARKLASSVGIETKVIFMDIPQTIVKERWQKNRQTNERFDVPDNIFEEALQLFEKPTKDESVLMYTENDSVDNWIKSNIK